jgi:DNA polymerase sigma
VIGSFAHGLWTASSDIDLAFVNTKPNPIDVPATLHTIYKSLRQHEKALDLHNIYLNKQSHATKFPNINLELNSSSNPHQRVDIIIFQRSNNGVKYVNWVNGWNMYPFFKPLFFILRGVLEKFQLHCQAKGGIKTYTLINMLTISLNHYGFQSLGDSLMQFCWYFSSVFQYEEKVNEQGEC